MMGCQNSDQDHLFYEFCLDAKPSRRKLCGGAQHLLGPGGVSPCSPLAIEEDLIE
jgi:hypothetical protein